MNKKSEEKALSYPSELTYSLSKGLYTYDKFMDWSDGDCLAKKVVNSFIPHIHIERDKDDEKKLDEIFYVPDDIEIKNNTKISGPVGDFDKNLKKLNSPKNVRIVKKLLNYALGINLELHGGYSQELSNAIYEYQKCDKQLNADRKIGRGGATYNSLIFFYFKQIDNINAPLILTYNGAYQINLWNWSLVNRWIDHENGYNLSLVLDDGSNIPLSARKKIVYRELSDKTTIKVKTNHLMYRTFSDDNLGKLVKYMDRNNLWTTKKRGGGILKFNLQLRYKNKTIKTSQQKSTLQVPPEPYKGALNPTLDGKVCQYPYIVDKNGKYDGRYFMKPIAGMFFFCYSSKFELNVDRCGFDCIEYVISLFNLDIGEKRIVKHPPGIINKPANATSSDVCAQLIGAKYVSFKDGNNDIVLNGVEGAVIKKYLEKNKKGVYLFWTGGHMRLIVNGVVHEYRNVAVDYLCTRVKDYKFPSGGIYLRKVPDDHPIASKWLDEKETCIKCK